MWKTKENIYILPTELSDKEVAQSFQTFFTVVRYGRCDHVTIFICFIKTPLQTYSSYKLLIRKIKQYILWSQMFIYRTVWYMIMKIKLYSMQSTKHWFMQIFFTLYIFIHQILYFCSSQKTLKIILLKKENNYCKYGPEKN